MNSSKEMEQLRAQMLKKSSPLDDRINLNKDLRNIYGDVRRVMSIGGVFSDCKTSDDWKAEKAAALDEKYNK